MAFFCTEHGIKHRGTCPVCYPHGSYEELTEKYAAAESRAARMAEALEELEQLKTGVASAAVKATQLEITSRNSYIDGLTKAIVTIRAALRESGQ